VSQLNIAYHYDLDNRDQTSYVFWFSHKKDSTTETLIRTNTSLFTFSSTKQDTTT